MPRETDGFGLNWRAFFLCLDKIHNLNLNECEKKVKTSFVLEGYELRGIYYRGSYSKYEILTSLATS